MNNLSVDCKQCGKRTYVFWAKDPVGKFIDYLRQSRPFVEQIFVTSHNSCLYNAFPAANVSGNEMDTSIDKGGYQIS